jgi:hypothetical protein
LKTTSQKLNILWAYGSEAVVASLILGGLLLFTDTPTLANFVQNAASDLAYFSGIWLAGAIAFLWAFYSKADTPFFQWLYDKGAYNVYLSAYVAAIAIYASLTVCLFLSPKLDNEIFSLAALWLLILGVTNIYTFTNNIIKQSKLNMEFNRKTRSNNEEP